MANVLEVAGGSDVSLGQFLPLALNLYLLLVGVHYIVHVRILKTYIVDLWVLDVHRRHRQRGSIWWVTPFLGFLLSSADQIIQRTAEPLCFLFTGKIQADLARIPRKHNKVGS